jgi:integrase
MSDEQQIQASGQSEEPKAEASEKKKRKGFRLFKRDDSGRDFASDAPGWKERDYYFRVQIHGKRYVRCLETNDATEAQRRARLKSAEIRDSLSRGDYKRLEKTKLRQTSTEPVSKLIVAYRNSAGDASKDTRTQNINAIKQLLADVYGTKEPEALPCSQINATLARRWFELATAKAQANPDQAEQTSIKRSANSRFVQAKSLFIPKAMAAYRESGLYIQSFDEFSSAFKTYRFGRVPKTEYNPPDDELISKTLTDWEKLEDRNLFLAIGHELAFGLRASEMGQVTWSLWTTRSGYPVIAGEIKVKNGTALVQVRALDPWFSILRTKIAAKGWRGEPDDYIITGSQTHRTDEIFRAVSDWMRAHGWETQKTNHALRAYAGSQIAMKFGIYEAQMWLRHSNVKVTEDHYSHFVKAFKPADPDSLPARWATAAQTFEPKILPAATA